MDKKPIDTPSDSASVVSTPDTVTFIEGNEITPLPMYVTTTTLKRLYGMKSSDILESILSPSTKKAPS